MDLKVGVPDAKTLCMLIYKSSVWGISDWLIINTGDAVSGCVPHSKFARASVKIDIAMLETSALILDTHSTAMMAAEYQQSTALLGLIEGDLNRLNVAVFSFEGCNSLMRPSIPCNYQECFVVFRSQPAKHRVDEWH